MIKCRSVYKSPDGKLVIIDAVLHNEHVVNIEISGDFFAYPEEAVEELENSLKGVRVTEIEKIILERASKIVFVGLDVKDLIKAYNEMKCIETPLNQ